MLEGDREKMDEVGQQLNWTLNHKAIFETQYIIDLDGKILALDDHLSAKGFEPGDSVPVDERSACNALEYEAFGLHGAL